MFKQNTRYTVYAHYLFANISHLFNWISSYHCCTFAKHGLQRRTIPTTKISTTLTNATITSCGCDAAFSAASSKTGCLIPLCVVHLTAQVRDLEPSRLTRVCLLAKLKKNILPRGIFATNRVYPCILHSACMHLAFIEAAVVTAAASWHSTYASHPQSRHPAPHSTLTRGPTMQPARQWPSSRRSHFLGLKLIPSCMLGCCPHSHAERHDGSSAHTHHKTRNCA